MWIQPPLARDYMEWKGNQIGIEWKSSRYIEWMEVASIIVMDDPSALLYACVASSIENWLQMSRDNSWIAIYGDGIMYIYTPNSMLTNSTSYRYKNLLGSCEL